MQFESEVNGPGPQSEQVADLGCETGSANSRDWALDYL